MICARAASASASACASVKELQRPSAGGRRLPAGLVRHQLDVGRHAHDADAVVGRGRDQAGDLRAVAIVAESADVVVDVVARELRASGEIRVFGVDSGVDDGHADARALAEGVRFGHVERVDVRLQARIGIVEGVRTRVGRGLEFVERLRDQHALVGQQLLDHRFTRGAGRNPEQHAVHLQLFDRPLGHQRERMPARQVADQRGRRGTDAVVGRGAVAVRRTADRGRPAGHRVGHRHHDELGGVGADLGRRAHFGRRCRGGIGQQRRRSRPAAARRPAARRVESAPRSLVSGRWAAQT